MLRRDGWCRTAGTREPNPFESGNRDTTLPKSKPTNGPGLTALQEP